MIQNARNYPNISLDVEGFELHQNDISEELLNSIDFYNSKDVVTKYVNISYTYNIKFCNFSCHFFQILPSN